MCWPHRKRALGCNGSSRRSPGRGSCAKAGWQAAPSLYGIGLAGPSRLCSSAALDTVACWRRHMGDRSDNGLQGHCGFAWRAQVSIAPQGGQGLRTACSCTFPCGGSGTHRECGRAQLRTRTCEPEPTGRQRRTSRRRRHCLRAPASPSRSGIRSRPVASAPIGALRATRIAESPCGRYSPLPSRLKTTTVRVSAPSRSSQLRRVQ